MTVPRHAHPVCFRLRKQFQKCLEENESICPGKSLAEVSIFFVGRECFTQLSDDDKSAIYEQHQAALLARAQRGLRELLLEQAEMLCRYEQQNIRNNDLHDIMLAIKTESRYQALRCVARQRDNILFNHLSFVQSPCKEKCVYRDQCADNLLEQVLFTKARRFVPCHLPIDTCTA